MDRDASTDGQSVATLRTKGVADCWACNGSGVSYKKTDGPESDRDGYVGIWCPICGGNGRV